ncbi:MAG: histidine kinase dimerization/phosphoacceptor domain -containing protein [Dehalococcoidia bacterium]|nr:histidine kinase dimerization/phosphoacceptor domain -containing protein [Dehalococcoidia bacterium]
MTLVVLAAAIVAALALAQTILMRRFDELEKRETRQNVDRAVSALYSDFSKVNIAWGDQLTASKVVFEGDETYLALSIDETTFNTLGLNFILFVPPGFGPIGYGFDLEEGKALPVPPDLARELQPGKPLMPSAAGQAGVTGILMLSDGPILVSTYPTVISLGSDPLEGRLVFARYLDDAHVARLSQVTHLPLTLYQFDDPAVPEKVRTIEATSGSDGPNYVKALSSDTVAGYGVLEDVYGEPALVMEVDLPRDIHHQGQATLLYLMCGMAAVATVTGVVGGYVVQRSFLLRALRLSNDVVKVRTTGDLSKRVEVTGNDEITTLQMSINSMLASLEKSQKELRESEAQNRALVKGIPDYMFRIAMDGTLLEGRSAKGGNMLEPYRQLQGRMLYRPLKKYSDLTREVITRGLDHMDLALKTGETQIFEFPLSVDGREYFYEVRMMASEKEGELLCVVFDVSQRHAEAQKKEILIKEIHHRVKNNLQVIASLLYLQSTRLDDAKIMQMFEESSNRVKSISLIHEKLYKDRLQPQTDQGEVDFGAYVRDLTDALFISYGVDRSAIRLVLDTSHTFLSLDAAVPCGLIVNELVSNALKYAFPGGRTGEIRIGLYGDPDGRVALVVRDNGVGLPPDTDLEHSSSLGLRLVKMLAQQLGAEVHIDGSKGAEFKFIFFDGKKKEQTLNTSQPRQSASAEVGGG